jgi:hypothetical protein
MDDRLSAQAPVKPVREVIPPPADPEVLRQGGDTIENATVIMSVPYADVGTTAGYADDYDEVCPYSISTSPDVVYSIDPNSDLVLDIDLCGSSYDTKLYVYDAGMNLIACNDDAYFDDECGVYVSFLLGVPMMAGTTYYVVIDGYGGDFGEYLISIIENPWCTIECPPEGFLEGEPDLVENYVDEYNGGCNTPGPPWNFQDLNFGPSFLDFCGVAGWYLFDGSNYRDTDWFTAVIGETGIIEITAGAESATNIFELGMSALCTSVVIIQNITVSPCSPSVMTIVGDPGTAVYPWVGSANFSNPGDVDGNMYDYILTIDGLAGTATEATTWSQVKGMYR